MSTSWFVLVPLAVKAPARAATAARVGRLAVGAAGLKEVIPGQDLRLGEQRRRLSCVRG